MEAAASFIQQFLKDDVSDEDKTIAIYVCDDILEHLKVNQSQSSIYLSICPSIFNLLILIRKNSL